MDIWNLTCQTFYLLLPVYLANIGATVSIKFDFLNFISAPIDGGKNFGKNRLLGEGKTWRGLIVGSVFAMIVVWLQTYLSSRYYFNNLSLLDYSEINLWLLGLISGTGALLGDLIASFFKRRLGLTRGASLPFIDQWDYITSYFLLLALLTRLNITIIVIAYLMTLILHPLSNLLAYRLKLKKVWW